MGMYVEITKEACEKLGIRMDIRNDAVALDIPTVNIQPAMFEGFKELGLRDAQCDEVAGMIYDLTMLNKLKDVVEYSRRRR